MADVSAGGSARADGEGFTFELLPDLTLGGDLRLAGDASAPKVEAVFAGSIEDPAVSAALLTAAEVRARVTLRAEAVRLEPLWRSARGWRRWSLRVLHVVRPRAVRVLEHAALETAEVSFAPRAPASLGAASVPGPAGGLGVVLRKPV